MLEDTMIRFMRGQIDCLISTTIIESGIDIPNANTIIINRADAFGLSELYQLRGRVGRFTRAAYAYLLIPKNFVLSSESEKRLVAIKKFQELGSGFKLAMEDLQIRGAGNLLGVEQHGYINSVGFDMYCRLLKAAIESCDRGQVTGQ
jgi:transcription-repair coupling factor (superfamily II helicase)